MNLKTILDARATWEAEHNTRAAEVLIHPDDAKALAGKLASLFQPSTSLESYQKGPKGSRTLTFREDAETPKGTVRFA